VVLTKIGCIKNREHSIIRRAFALLFRKPENTNFIKVDEAGYPEFLNGRLTFLQMTY
jgi:hypothetical protein